MGTVLVEDLRPLPEIISGEDGVILPEGGILEIFEGVRGDEVQGRSNAHDLPNCHASDDT